VSYFKKNEFAVIRRFSDFLGLHQKLSEKYLQNGRIIPPAPDKSVVGTTKIKMAKEAENQVQDEVADCYFKN
jgi:sorting nexin-1/2